ncbi:DoxX family protein [Staphylococcus schleiferi subsp. coagulans]|uniref:DoxX family protein n=1 Tax=Staphylococcus coagulans TaxID=74706 RepID=UPI0015F7F035|nr:DoxX family protein [Staphylococcus coagulans]MBA8779482.1 DoxX family protein [Staphylococcus coagulans]
MILRYVTNLKAAKSLFDAAQPKLKGDEGMKEAFKTFKLSEGMVKVIGTIELIASGLFVASLFHKRISQAASLLSIGVLVGAIYKHFEAGQGKEGAQHAIDVATLAGLSLVDTLTSKK